jgi:hypothetical protein
MEQFTQEEVDKWWATISQQDKERILGAKSHFNGKHQNEPDKIITIKHLDVNKSDFTRYFVVNTTLFDI